jgi:hypothetical protein
MQQNNKKRGNNSWSSAIGWLIFILVVAGAPLLNLLRGALGGVVNLPANLLPILIGGLVALSVLVSVVRSLGSSRRNQGDTRLPTGNAPMPPFGGPAAPRMPPTTITPPQAYNPAGREQRLPGAPRFEPVLNPKIVAIGIVGVLLLAGAGLLLAGSILP